MGTCYLIKGRENAKKPYRAEWYDYHSKPGKRLKGGSATFADEREGNKWWQDQERENAAFFGADVRVRPRAFDGYAEEWARTLTKSTETNRSYRSQVRALKKHFKDTPIAAITKADVKAMKADIVDAGLSAGTVKVRLTTLRAIMQSAIDDGLRGDDPTRKVEPPRMVKHEARILTADEMDRVVEHLPERLRAPALLAYYTGMRIGEVCGARARHLDLLHASLRVVYVRMADGTEREYPKNGRVDQSVGLPGPVVAVLRDHIDKFPPLEEGHLFSWRPRGRELRPLDQSTLRRYWRKACEAAKLENGIPRFHDLRHTCATTLARNNQPAYIIQAQLRHGRLDTSQRYIDETPDDQRLQALNAVYGAASTPPKAA